MAYITCIKKQYLYTHLNIYKMVASFYEKFLWFPFKEPVTANLF